MTVGLPRSGKSTWSQTQNFPIVSLDCIRLAFHGNKRNSIAEPFIIPIAKVMVQALFNAGHNTVILDSNAVTKAKRKEWESKSWIRKYVEFYTEKEICIERAKQNNQEDLIPVIERLDSERDPITNDEM